MSRAVFFCFTLASLAAAALLILAAPHTLAWYYGMSYAGIILIFAAFYLLDSTRWKKH